jgi:hypothetical protein
MTHGNARLRRPLRIFEDRVEIPLTRGKVAIVDLIDADLAYFNWTTEASQDGLRWYAHRNGPRPRRECIKLHREIAKRMGLKLNGREVDHHDGDGLNCRRVNLRRASSGQNKHNARKPRNNKSGFKGISWRQDSQKWQVHIQANKKAHYLGLFADLSTAVAARSEAAQRLHGEYARAV